MAQKYKLTTSDHLSYDEFTRLLECLRKDKEYQWEMFARLSFCTACRASDVLTLKWGDILDLPSMMVVEKKTQKPRRVSFNPSVQKCFQDLWELLGHPEKDEYIMTSNRTPGHVTIQHVNRKLKEFKHKYNLNIENFSTHTFRKTFGRFVYETNHRSAESLILLNKILNHTSIQVTKTYIGITQEEIDNIYASICM